ncbi:MAG TPA: sensor domain-containing diguanylate cyclase, partial [Anaerolineales bacterium]|nr:sensor domain-containing diguanylate cyclase [Anaerolineales bacterium]
MDSHDERHYHMLFEYAPISLWEEDYSEIKKFFNSLRSKGVQDFARYLNENPQTISDCMARIKVVDVNAQTLVMFGASNKDDLIAHLDNIFRDEMRRHFQDELVALWQGAVTWSGEGINYTLRGEPLNVRLHWRILPGYEETFERVLVTLEDITERKQIERALEVSEARFRNLFDYAPISLWEEDYSALKEYLDNLHKEGATDLRAYLEEHPEAVQHCMGLIRVLDVNLKTLQLFGAQKKEELLSNLDKIFRDEMSAHFVNELVDMWNGKTFYERDGINYSISGEPINIHLGWRLMPDHEQDFSWVLVAIEDITIRKKAEDYLRYLGTHDVMTGVYNRAYFEEKLGELEKDRHEPISIIIADLNGLKVVNDTLGHQAGDGMIRRMGEVLKASLDETDFAARIGGDEFALVLPGVEKEGAREALERIKSLIVLNNKYYREPELSMALGAATSLPELSLERVIAQADDAMYADKRH